MQSLSMDRGPKMLVSKMEGRSNKLGVTSQLSSPIPASGIVTVPGFDRLSGRIGNSTSMRYHEGMLPTQDGVTYLEYCQRFWAPYIRKDVLVLEGVQRRFTRIIPGMKSLSYEERLWTLGLYSVEFRRTRGDLIETYRIPSGLDTVDVEKTFPLVGETRTRGHSLRVKGRSFRTEVRRNFFSQRLVSLWNSLLQKVVEDESLRIFKAE
eukprot:g44685.t1